MARQYLQDGPYVDPSVADALAANAATSAVSMWDGSVFTPLFANDAKAGKIYAIEAGGLITTGATGALTLAVGLGTTSPGTTLGASIAQTVPVSAPSGPWFLESRWVGVRSSTTGATEQSLVKVHSIAPASLVLRTAD